MVDRVVKAARVFDSAAYQLEEVRAETKPDATIDSADLDEKFGMLAGAIVLEALALELILKARLLRAGVQPPKWRSHSDLYALLPEVEQQGAEQTYQADRHGSMRATLPEVLDFSAKAFERYVIASTICVFWSAHAQRDGNSDITLDIAQHLRHSNGHRRYRRGSFRF
jgi:hypothetical protein